MKQTAIGLSHKYVAALQKHLRPGPRGSLRPAHDLGCQAAALDLETPTRKLLQESLRLRKHLQRLTHQTLSADETQRKEISHKL